MTEAATPKPEPLEGIIVSGEDAALVTVQARPALEIFTTPGVVPALLARIREEATTLLPPDTSTDKGRKDIASRAFKVAKSKTYLDDLGKDEVARLKELPRQVDAARKALRDGLDALRDEIRKPLTEWEERRERLQKRLSIMQNTPATVFSADAIAIRSSIETVEAQDPASFEEFAAEAASIKMVTLATLQDMLEKRQKWEDDQAELARLREADAKRKQEEKDEELRKEGEARARQQAAAPMVVETPLGALPLPPGAIGAMVGMNGQELEFVPATPAPAPVTMGQADALRRGEPLQDAAADVEHRRAFNREALADLLKVLEEAHVEGDDPIDPAGQRDIAAKAILTAIVTGKVRHITITY